jgi:uridine monophosphate synthetase
MNKTALILELHEIGLIKFGSFVFKSGIVSPNYLDHRILVSYPKTLQKIADAYITILNKLTFDRMIAIPYTAMPIVGAISLKNGKPWIYTRKESKGYGTNKMIEGIYSKGETAILVDDVITTGGSKFETVEKLKQEELHIHDVVVFIDRQQGGREEVEKRGMELHSVLTLTEIFDTLLKAGTLTKEQYTINMKSINT